MYAFLKILRFRLKTVDSIIYAVDRFQLVKPSAHGNIIKTTW